MQHVQEGSSQVGKVIKIDIERWVDVFNKSQLAIQVSSKGRVKFMTTGTDPWSTLSMEQIARLGSALTEAYGGNDEEGG